MICLREALGLSQGELAAALGCVNRAVISHYETGRAYPSAEVLIKLGSLTQSASDRSLILRELADKYGILPGDLAWLLDSEVTR